AVRRNLLEMAIRFARCISESSRKTEALDRCLSVSEARLDNLIQRNADGVVIVDHGGDVVFINPAGEGLFARPSSEFVGQPFGFPCVAGSTAEIDIIRPGRTPAAAEMRVAETVWDSRPALVATLRDVTQREGLG